MKGRQIPYSHAELRWIRAHCRDDRREAHAAFCAKFGRADVALKNFNALCKRKGWMTGRTGRLEKGNIPHNKGKPCPPGKGGRHPNARKTQFKRGSRSGVAVKLYKPVGTERISKDGYVERKINDDKPEYKRWRGVHLVNWEAINGPLPKGHCLKCLDGNRQNTDPANWEAIPRGVHVHLTPGRSGNGFNYDAAPDELKPTILAVAKLKHASRTKGLKSAQRSEVNDA